MNKIFLLFSPIFKNQIFFPHTSILMILFCFVTLQAIYLNDPNKVKKCNMLQIIEIFLARGKSKYLLTPTKNILYQNCQVLVLFSVAQLRLYFRKAVEMKNQQDRDTTKL